MKSTSQDEKYRIVLADDHQILREGLHRLIGEDPELQVVGEAGDGQELLDLMNDTPCEMVILDISMPNLDGLESLALIRERFPETKVLILSMHGSKEYFKKAIGRGANGYILKENAYDRLLWAIREIRAGRKAQSPAITEDIVNSAVNTGHALDDVSLEILTGREKQVLGLVARGRTSRNIGEELGISPRTVESHRARIMEKLGVTTTAEMIRYALNKNLV